jgi:delta 1-pyrroline-5-carboxylate dehydrogenase
VNTNMMHEVLAESQAGKLIFPKLVRRLLEDGVESSFCDQAKRQETFYARDGKTRVEKMTLLLSAVAEEFNSSGLIAAIRGPKRI